MSQLSHAQFPLRRHPNLLVDHRRSRSAAVAEPRGANGEAVTGSGGRLHFGMVAGIKSERWPTSNRNPRPDCLGIRSWLALSSASVSVSRPHHVSCPRHVERSLRISRTALPHLLRAEGYGTYPAGATFSAVRFTR